MSHLLSIYWRHPQDDAVEWCLRSSGGVLSSGSTTLAQLAKNQGQQAHEAVELWVGGEDVLHFAVMAPTKRQSLLKSAVLYLAEEYLAQDVEQMHLAINKPSDDGLLGLCVLDQKRFASMIQQLGEHGLAPDRALPDYLGLVAPAGEAVMVLDSAADRALLRIGDLCASQPGGLAGTPDWLTKVLASHEMSRRKQPILRLYGDVDDERLQQMRQQLSGWTIQPQPIPQDMDHRLMVGQLQTSSGDEVINLCTGDYKRRKQVTLDFAQLKPLVRTAVVFAIVLTATVLIKIAGLWWDTYSLRAESRQLVQAAFLDRALSDEEIDRQLETLHAQSEETGIVDFLHLLGVFSEVATGLQDRNLDVEAVQYNYSRSDLSVSVTLSDLEHLDRLNRALSETGLAVDINSAQQSPGGLVQARISLAEG